MNNSRNVAGIDLASRVITQVKGHKSSIQAVPGGRCLPRERFYAHVLTQLPEVLEQIETGWLSAQQVKDIAGLFAELDIGLEGELLPHDVGYFLHRIGHAVPARDLVIMLDGMSNGRGHCRFNFLDMVELVGGLWDCERAHLSAGFEELAGPGEEVGLDKVNDLLSTCGLTLRKDHIKQVATSLALSFSDEGGKVYLTNKDQLVKLVAHCRNVERERFLERAGFLHEEATEVASVFDCFEGEVTPEAQRQGLKEVGLFKEPKLHCVGFSSESSCGNGPAGANLQVSEDENNKFAFVEFLHFSRRLLYWEEFRAAEHEWHAAIAAGLTEDEVAALKKLYHALVREGVAVTMDKAQESTNVRAVGRRPTIANMLEAEDAVRAEFSYVMLAKAVRLFGAALTVEQDEVLQARFREHALPSKKRFSQEKGAIERFHLLFPNFLIVVGWLWQTNFAGVVSAAGRRCQQQGSESDVGELSTTSILAKVARQYASIIAKTTA